MDRDTVVVALIGPAVTATVTAVVVWLRDVIARRDEAFRRREALTTATQEVQFFEAWIAASRALDIDGTRSWVNEQVRADLARAYALVAQATVGDTPLDRKRPTLREMLGAIFLWRKLKSPWARAGLVIHYYLLFQVLAFSSTLVLPFGEEYDATIFWGAAIILSFSIGLVWFWRKLLLWVDQRHRAANEPQAGDDSQVTATAAQAAIDVFEQGAWRQGVLLEWRPTEVSWSGRARFSDGTVTDWVPSERLRYTSEPDVAGRSQN